MAGGAPSQSEALKTALAEHGKLLEFLMTLHPDVRDFALEYKDDITPMAIERGASYTLADLERLSSTIKAEEDIAEGLHDKVELITKRLRFGNLLPRANGIKYDLDKCFADWTEMNAIQSTIDHSSGEARASVLERLGGRLAELQTTNPEKTLRQALANTNATFLAHSLSAMRKKELLGKRLGKLIAICEHRLDMAAKDDPVRRAERFQAALAEAEATAPKIFTGSIQTPDAATTPEALTFRRALQMIGLASPEKTEGAARGSGHSDDAPKGGEPGPT